MARHPRISKKGKAVSENKRTVQRYMDAFTKTDHVEILSCLTDDVEWVIPGAFHITGKDAFDKETENEAFVGSRKLGIRRLVEEDAVVGAEGIVQQPKKNGERQRPVFWDLFAMQNAKIGALTS